MLKWKCIQDFIITWLNHTQNMSAHLTWPLARLPQSVHEMHKSSNRISSSVEFNRHWTSPMSPQLKGFCVTRIPSHTLHACSADERNVKNLIRYYFGSWNATRPQLARRRRRNECDMNRASNTEKKKMMTSSAHIVARSLSQHQFSSLGELWKCFHLTVRKSFSSFFLWLLYALRCCFSCEMCIYT